MALESPKEPRLDCYGISPDCTNEVMYCVNGSPLWLCWTCYVAMARSEMRQHKEAELTGDKT